MHFMSLFLLAGTTALADAYHPLGPKGIVFTAAKNASAYNHSALSAGGGNFNIFAIPEAQPCPKAFKAAHPYARVCHTSPENRQTVFLPLTTAPGPLMLNSVEPKGGQQVYFNNQTGAFNFLQKGTTLPKGAHKDFFIDSNGYLAAFVPSDPVGKHPVACGGIGEPYQIRMQIGSSVPEGCAFIFFQTSPFDGYGAYHYGE